MPFHPPEPFFRVFRGTFGHQIGATRRGSVSLIFAIALIPIMMLVGLALDFGFYSEAQAQLDMAADTAAMHAARVGMLLLQQKDETCKMKGQDAGRRWFDAQLGALRQLSTAISPEVNVDCTLTSTKVTAQVHFAGYIVTHFFRLFPANWPGYPYWGIAGTSTATVSIPSFNNVYVLADNSSSMMIAATSADIQKMTALTPCSAQAASVANPSSPVNQDFNNNYSWVYTTANGFKSNFPGSAVSTTPVSDADLSATYGTSPLFVGGKLFLPYGFGTLFYPQNTSTTTKLVSAAMSYAPPPVGSTGACDVQFTSEPNANLAACPYPGSLFVAPLAPAGVALDSQNQCTLNGKPYGGGEETTWAVGGAAKPDGWLPRMHTPVAPCAFACHNSTNTGSDPTKYDFYNLATTNGVTLRYTVLQNAIGETIQAMQTSPAANQLAVGVYQFNAPKETCQTEGLLQVYPPVESTTPDGCNTSGTWFSGREAGTDFPTAANNAKTIQPPLTGDRADTDFENAMAQLGNTLKPAGSGALPTSPRKSLFIITDGMDDYYIGDDGGNPNNIHQQKGRVQYQIDPDLCSKFKEPVEDGGLGYSIYVLYVDYYPLPNQWYLQWANPVVGKPLGGGDSPGVAALKACASKRTSPYFIEVRQGNLTNIASALNQMLDSAIGSAGRYTD